MKIGAVYVWMYLSFKKAIVRAVDIAATIASGLLRNPNPTYENL